MKKIIRNNTFFLVPLGVIWLALSILLIGYSKTNIHLYINEYHNNFFDIFFRFTTFFGDGLTPVIISVVFLFVSFRKSLIIGVGAIIAGVFSQGLKHLFFSNVMRPRAYFEGIAELYFVPNFNVHTHFSFPSGHTTTAFCLFFIIAFFINNKIGKLSFLMLALIAAYSRMYLSQHFLIDVYFGALLGLVSAFISILVFKDFKSRWLDKSFITIYKAK